MRALVWRGERKLELEEIPDPVPAEGEVVLEVDLAGICGSDLHPYRGHAGPRVPPLVLGHEVVGRTGGERFVVFPLEGCGRCERCLAGEVNLCDSWRLLGMHRPGVFAERVAVPQHSLVRVPPGMEAERAVLAEPLACCVGALRPHVLASASRVLVLGCGPIGLLTVFLAARSGAEVVAVDPIAERRAQAERLGAACAVHSADEVGPAAVELAVDAAGFETTWRGGIDAVRSGGTVVVVGLGQAEGIFPMAVVVRRALNVRGQFAYSRADFAQAVDVLATSDLDLEWITHSPLDEGAQAFANLVDRPAEYSKVLLRP
jgi:threonine dehydrogenase-like Zn-dependent dehydrogenase